MLIVSAEEIAFKRAFFSFFSYRLNQAVARKTLFSYRLKEFFQIFWLSSGYFYIYREIRVSKIMIKGKLYSI